MNQDENEEIVISSQLDVVDEVASEPVAPQAKKPRRKKRRNSTSQRARTVSRTRKSAVTRERIIRCAAGLMEQRGSTAFQMSEVSQLCSMSKGALYYYFADRGDLVNAVFSQELHNLVVMVRQVFENAPSACEALREFCSEFGRVTQDNPVLAMALIYDLNGTTGPTPSEYNDHFETVVAAVAKEFDLAKREGAVRGDVDVELSSISLCGALCFTALRTKSGESLPEGFTQHLFEQTLRGISS